MSFGSCLSPGSAATRPTPDLITDAAAADFPVSAAPAMLTAPAPTPASTFRRLMRTSDPATLAAFLVASLAGALILRSPLRSARTLPPVSRKLSRQYSLAVERAVDNSPLRESLQSDSGADLLVSAAAM